MSNLPTEALLAATMESAVFREVNCSVQFYQAQVLPGDGSQVVCAMLGRGGFGDVALAIDKDTLEYKVLKFFRGLHQEEPEKELAIANKLRLAAIEQLLLPDPDLRVMSHMEKNQAKKTFFLTFHGVGVSLSNVMDKNTSGLPSLLVKNILRQLLAGLGAMHAAGWVHSDVKVDNLLLLLENVAVDRLVVDAVDQGRFQINMAALVRPKASPVVDPPNMSLPRDVDKRRLDKQKKQVSLHRKRVAQLKSIVERLRQNLATLPQQQDAELRWRPQKWSTSLASTWLRTPLPASLGDDEVSEYVLRRAARESQGGAQLRSVVQGGGPVSEHEGEGDENWVPGLGWETKPLPSILEEEEADLCDAEDHRNTEGATAGTGSTWMRTALPPGPNNTDLLSTQLLFTNPEYQDTGFVSMGDDGGEGTSAMHTVEGGGEGCLSGSTWMHTALPEGQNTVDLLTLEQTFSLAGGLAELQLASEVYESREMASCTSLQASESKASQSLQGPSSPQPVSVGATVSSSPQPASVGATVSSSPQPASVGATVSSSPQPASVGATVSSSPQPVSVGATVSSSPQPASVGATVSSLPQPASVGAAVSSSPQPVSVGAAVSSSPQPASVGAAVSSSSGGEAFQLVPAEIRGAVSPFVSTWLRTPLPEDNGTFSSQSGGASKRTYAMTATMTSSSLARCLEELKLSLGLLASGSGDTSASFSPDASETQDGGSGASADGPLPKRVKVEQEEKVRDLTWSLGSLSLEDDELDPAMLALLPDGVSPQLNVKIVDFGLTTKFKQGQKRHSPGGTLSYMAPEALVRLKSDLRKVDVWAVYATAFELATGWVPHCCPPGDFTFLRQLQVIGEQRGDLPARVLNSPYLMASMPAGSTLPGGPPRLFPDLTRRLLAQGWAPRDCERLMSFLGRAGDLNPESRASIDELLLHPFLN